MITLLRTDSQHPDYQVLIPLLDAELAHRDGSEHAFYAQFNKSDHIQHVVVGYFEGKAVACGALKQCTPTQMEVKRMFVRPEFRGHRYAGDVLQELERWAIELGFQQCILETGVKQPEAIALYQRNGYQRIPNYGQYAGVENSVCMRKVLG
ncbi:MAG: GNAT family N-acetyltransferase [Bacteroidetes bacterium]|nr:GNAT family N-acetyltransferase [Bacteroidota bacterium]